MFNRPRRHLITGITTIGKEFGYGGKTVQRAGYDVQGLVAILNARIMNFAKQQIALSINAYMAFAALYFRFCRKLLEYEPAWCPVVDVAF